MSQRTGRHRQQGDFHPGRAAVVAVTSLVWLAVASPWLAGMVIWERGGRIWQAYALGGWVLATEVTVGVQAGAWACWLDAMLVGGLMLFLASRRLRL